MKAEHCNATYFSGNFSCLIAQFHFRRSLGQSMLQIYIPSMVIVVISWISFWIDPTSVPGRVGLAVTTLLTLATQAAGIAYNLPPVGYTKAIDVWLSICLLFLFGGLIEFTIVNSYTRKWESLTRKDVTLTLPLFPSMTTADKERAKIELCHKYQEKAVMIDKFSRVMFPIVFGLFLAVYWCMYLM